MASRTSGRAGSIMPTRPTRVSPARAARRAARRRRSATGAWRRRAHERPPPPTRSAGAIARDRSSSSSAATSPPILTVSHSGTSPSIAPLVKATQSGSPTWSSSRDGRAQRLGDVVDAGGQRMNGGHPLAVGVERQLEDARQGDLADPSSPDRSAGRRRRAPSRWGHRSAAAVVGDRGVVAQRATGEQQAQRGLVAQRLGARSAAADRGGRAGRRPCRARRPSSGSGSACPVLSEQIVVTEPSVSTAYRRRMSALLASIRWAPRARVMVTTAGRLSGIAATARLTAVSSNVVEILAPQQADPEDEQHDDARHQRQPLDERVEPLLQRRPTGRRRRATGRRPDRARTPCRWRSPPASPGRR